MSRIRVWRVRIRLLNQRHFFLTGKQSSMIPASRLLFVSGYFRSGTSLLWAMLNQHPGIAIFYETNVLAIPLPPRLRYRRNWVSSAKNWGGFIERHGLEGDGALACARSMEDLYRLYARRMDALYGGEKDPSICTRLGGVIREFPHCKMVVIYRDPVEIYSSILSAGREDRFFGRKGMLERMVCSTEKMMADCRRLNEGAADILYVRYKDIVTDSEGVCRRICVYLGLPFDPRMTDLSTADLSPVYRATHHDKLRSRTISGLDASGKDPLTQGTRDFLLRFGNRASRLFRSLETRTAPAGAGPDEPTAAELEPYLSKGEKYVQADDLKRLIYHCLPPGAITLYKAARRFCGDQAVRSPGRTSA